MRKLKVLFLFSLILHHKIVKLHKKTLSYISIPILSNLYSLHFIVFASLIRLHLPLYYLYLIFPPWSITTAWATPSNLLVIRIKALSTKNWDTYQQSLLSTYCMLSLTFLQLPICCTTQTLPKECRPRRAVKQ